MKTFFKDIFEYHHYFNQKLAEQLIENTDRIPESVIPLLSHSVNAHQIWNSRILRTRPMSVHQVHTPEKCNTINNSNYRNTVKILRDFTLEGEITYRNSKGDVFKNTIREILFHVANHFSHHRGQIVSDLRQSGIIPLKTDYIFYKR